MGYVVVAGEVKGEVEDGRKLAVDIFILFSRALKNYSPKFTTGRILQRRETLLFTSKQLGFKNCYHQGLMT